MKPRSVTVFVHRRGGVFEANTHRGEAISLDSATIAARRAAAADLEVPESEIELLPEGDHVMIATVRTPGRPVDRALQAATAAIVAAGVAAIVWLMKGGA